MGKSNNKMLTITELTGVYAASYDNDLKPTEIKSIVQDIDTGEVYFLTDQYGVCSTNYDFVGSLEELKKLQRETESKR